MCNKLLEENALLSVFDPKVTREQMYLDLGKEKIDKMEIEDDPYLSCAGAHAPPLPPSPSASHPPHPHTHSSPSSLFGRPNPRQARTPSPS